MPPEALANARKLDDDLGVIVEGGLATLAIGRYMQRLREVEMCEGVSPVASAAIRETMLRFSGAFPQTGEMLSMLENLCQILSMAMEAMHADDKPSVQTTVLQIRDEQSVRRDYRLWRGKGGNAIPEIQGI